MTLFAFSSQERDNGANRVDETDVTPGNETIHPVDRLAMRYILKKTTYFVGVFGPLETTETDRCRDCDLDLLSFLARTLEANDIPCDLRPDCLEGIRTLCGRRCTSIGRSEGVGIV